MPIPSVGEVLPGVEWCGIVASQFKFIIHIFNVFYLMKIRAIQPSFIDSLFFFPKEFTFLLVPSRTGVTSREIRIDLY